MPSLRTSPSTWLKNITNIYKLSEANQAELTRVLNNLVIVKLLNDKTIKPEKLIKIVEVKTTVELDSGAVIDVNEKTLKVKTLKEINEELEKDFEDKDELKPEDLNPEEMLELLEDSDAHEVLDDDDIESEIRDISPSGADFRKRVVAEFYKKIEKVVLPPKTEVTALLRQIEAELRREAPGKTLSERMDPKPVSISPPKASSDAGNPGLTGLKIRSKLQELIDRDAEKASKALAEKSDATVTNIKPPGT